MDFLPGTARRRVVTALSLISVAAILAACGSSGSGASGSGSGSASSSAPSGSSSLLAGGTKATGAAVKIGLIYPEGGAAVSQPEIGAAGAAAVKYANSALGGIGGHPVQLDVCKSLETVPSVRNCANQMVSDKVAAVVLGTSGFGATIVPIVTGAGIPYVTVSGNTPQELTAKGSYTWTGGFPGTLIQMAKFAAEKGYKNVTALAVNVPAAIEGAKAAGVPTFKAAGVTLKVVGVPYGAADVTPQIQSTLTTKPDALVVIEDASGCTSVLKAMATLQVTQPKLLIQPCLDPNVIKAVGKSGVEGAYVFSTADTVSTDKDTQLYLAAMKKYAPQFSTQGYAVVGWQGVLGLIRAAKGLAGAVTPAALSTAISTSTDVALPAGHGITFTCNGKAVPGAPAACSTAGLVITVKGGVGTNPQVIK